MITILRRRVKRNIWVASFKDQGHSATLRQNRVRPITSLFEVGFRKYFTGMITILRRRVTHNIWVATLKVKVTAQPLNIMTLPRGSQFDIELYKENCKRLLLLNR